MAQFRLDPEKSYDFPESEVIKYSDKYLLIAPDIACWIVLDNLEQLSVWEYFNKGNTIKEALNNKLFKSIDVTSVVTQIEARRFYKKEVFSSTKEDRTLHLYLTNGCNLSCPHCYMYSGKTTENELTTEEIFKLLFDYKNDAYGTHVTISGGEPTMRHDFDAIVQYAAEIGLKVKVLTNGTLMTSHRIDRLAKYLTSVQVSIDGYSEETNSLIRGKGHFTKALQSVDTLISYGIETSIAITPPIDILKQHYEEYINFIQSLSDKYSGKCFHIKVAEELIKGRSVLPTHALNLEYAKLANHIQKEVYGSDYDVMSFVRSIGNNFIKDNCMFGVFAVASNGDVYNCARISDLPPVANIRKMSVKDIYLQSMIAEKASIITNLKPCKDCVLRFICGGGCRIDDFPELVNLTSFSDVDYDKIPSKSCKNSTKEKFYDLMIRSNRYFYLPIT